MFKKIDDLRSCNPRNSLKKSTKAAILVALISSLGLVVQKIIEILPVIL